MEGGSQGRGQPRKEGTRGLGQQLFTIWKGSISIFYKGCGSPHVHPGSSPGGHVWWVSL